MRLQFALTDTFPRESFRCKDSNYIGSSQVQLSLPLTAIEIFLGLPAYNVLRQNRDTSAACYLVAKG